MLQDHNSRSQSCVSSIDNARKRQFDLGKLRFPYAESSPTTSKTAVTHSIPSGHGRRSTLRLTGWTSPQLTASSVASRSISSAYLVNRSYVTPVESMGEIFLCTLYVCV